MQKQQPDYVHENWGLQMKNFSRKDVDLIRASGLLDADWYVKQYPDVKALGMEPAEHYLWLGARLFRNPSPIFDTAAYLVENVDVSSAGINPLLHYLRWGKGEGREIYKPRSPVNLPTFGDSPRPTAVDRDFNSTLARIEKGNTPPAIIVPIYNAPEETEDCILSVLRHTNKDARLILIDDASPDPRVKKVLSRYEGIPNVTIIHNEQNMGFTRTVNRGIELAGKTDVVFLNSDTKVTPFWLRNLQLAVYSDERVATATPFSNNAGAFSAPVFGRENPIPHDLSLDSYARLITRNSGRIYPHIPTGNGFCMYVRRECIEQIGVLDAEAFPRGYGEENDFCMRAGKAGWRHVIDDSTLVYHVRSASFGDEKNPLMKQGRAIIDQRYPEYTKSVREFIADPLVAKARDNVRLAVNKNNDKKVKVRVLYVISTRTGGTPQTNEDLMKSLDDRVETYVLHCDRKRMSLFRFISGEYKGVETHVLKNRIEAFPHRSKEYDTIIREWLIRYAFELVHVRHIAWHSLGLVDEASHLQIPILYSFHDFYSVCPTIKLLDEKMQYCGGTCTKGHGKCQMELWNTDDYPTLKHNAVFKWRDQFAEILEKCSAFFTTSVTAKNCLTDAFPFLKNRPFHVIPHGRDFSNFDQPEIDLQPGEPIRLLIPGNISPAKGGHFVSELSKRAKKIGLEIHVLGKVARAVDTSNGITLHGPYERADFMNKVRSIKPHVGGVFSIWPETFCHTLTELWACGIPAIGFHLGAVGERLEETGAGWLSQPNIEELVTLLMKIRDEPKSLKKAQEAVFQWQKTQGRASTCQNMATAYWNLYDLAHE